MPAPKPLCFAVLAPLQLSSHVLLRVMQTLCFSCASAEDILPLLTLPLLLLNPSQKTKASAVVLGEEGSTPLLCGAKGHPTGAAAPLGCPDGGAHITASKGTTDGTASFKIYHLGVTYKCSCLIYTSALIPLKHFSPTVQSLGFSGPGSPASTTSHHAYSKDSIHSKELKSWNKKTNED